MATTAKGATPTSHTTKPRTQGLRTRAVLYEADLRDERTKKRRAKRQPITLTSDEAARCPLLAAHLILSGGFPPSLTRSYAARSRHLNAMYAAHGPLVLLRYHLDELNEWPLRSDDLPDEARPLIVQSAAELLRSGTPHTVNLQRGATGRTHWHPVAPLAGLLPEHAELVTAARHGPGGGCELLDGIAHGTVMWTAPVNRSKVARYVTRHPDGRLDYPGTPDYLDALEDELWYLATRTTTSKRMGWEVGVRPLL